MKIKLIEPGWESYTGPLGAVQFVDGVSVEHVPQSEARTIAATLAVADAETGKDPGEGASFIQLRGELSAPVTTLPTLADLRAQSAVSEDSVAPAGQVRKFSEAELGEVGDKQGIKGLRAIADELGVKGTSIAALISGILAAQGAHEPAVAIEPLVVVAEPAVLGATDEGGE